MNPIDILSVAKLSPFYEAHLRAHHTLHDRLHEGDAAAFSAVAPRIRAIAATGESRVTAALMDRLPALEIISVFGVGYDGVDAVAAQQRGIMVTHTPAVLNDDVADLALALMLAVSRQIPAADRFVREGRWPTGPLPLGRKMSGAHLGLVGMGRIAEAIAHRAQAFGMSIAYTARNARPHLPHRYLPDPASLAREVDYLVVITPGGAGTRHLINAEVLRALGPQGILINVARGSVVDQQALIDALSQGGIAAAGLDVFDNEPQVPEALRALPNVVLTPHIGSATRDTRQAMADLAYGNLEAHFSGQAVRTPVPECTPR